ncbi:hypothetical protein [Archangium sp. Cb G35]|uniref:hypothetical protein n=1 Tax=Archangium sp. Cb G35 TaxID=1920190 RepID=UPI000935DDBA|nr:hypothetical protein [Archangium sp. Cb G35]
MRSFLLLALAGATALTACRASVEEQPPVPTVPQVSRHPERRGISLLTVSGPQSLAGTEEDIVVDPRRSLAVTDEVILARFSFEEVMNRLAEQSGVPGLTGLRLYQEWWDSQRKAPGLGLGGPHCGDELLPDGKPGFNRFPYSCPREEWRQALENPFLEPATSAAAYVPIGLFNRFDLAAADGSDCGEYRIVFARRSGMSELNQRNLIAFEGVLPNPKPRKGLDGCRKVARFWAELSREPDPAARAEALYRFYFEGVGKFPPVIHPDRFGNATEGATGQVRTNQFIQQSTTQGTWTLREFRLRTRCTGNTCMMRFEPDLVKTNPAGILFSAKQEHPLKEAFSEALVSQVESLAVNDLLRFSLDVEERFNSGQSHANGTENLYAHQLGKGDGPLRRKLQQRLNELGSPLSVDNIVARAQVLSCAGCHQLSTNADLGGGLSWPDKKTPFTFVHVSERTTEEGPDGSRFGLSGVLVNTFLPPRQQLLEAFLERRPPFDKQPDPDDECQEPEVRGARAAEPGQGKPDKDRCEEG